MSATQIPCHGCGRFFAPRGLSQHLGKSQDPRCRSALRVSRAQAGSLPIQNLTSSRPPSPNNGAPIEQDNDIEMLDDETRDFDAPDNADTVDTDAFEQLRREQLTVGEAPGDSGFTHQPDQPADQPEPDDQAGAVEPAPESAAVVVDRFPFGRPGAPSPDMTQASQQAASMGSPWAPFRSQLDWDIARWAKLRGQTSTAVSELLAIPGVVDSLGLSFQSVNELNDIIDGKMEGRPTFQCRAFKVGNEDLEFYCRDVIECIRVLYGDLRFAEHLVFAPERHYTSHERSCRIYNDMHTGDWWWMVQDTLERRAPGATVIPLIVSSDKTQLTLFRDKMAYPIYLTIGNIPKQIRRKVSTQAQILLGYIPTTKLVSVSGATARRRTQANLFHACMENALGPISLYGETGIDMKSGDGIWRRCHPIFASFVGDYPEQALVTCTYYGRCPKCKVPLGQLGEYRTFRRHAQSTAINTYRLCDGPTVAFNQACREARIKPVYHPFWELLPLTDIFLSITPDILHQLLQGMVKHLVAWLVGIFGAAVIDARCRMIPPNHGIMLFTRGITSLSHVSGHEHKKMCSILLGLVVDLPVPGGFDSTRVIRAVRALMDFLYLAQFESHTSDTLSWLEECLAGFHENKQVFIDLEVRENFELPKLHSLMHYASSIRLFGSTDNYNTEQSERLHIDLTKDAYRATNRKDEYSQMTKWLERREKVLQHTVFVTQRQGGHINNFPAQNVIGPPRACALELKMAQNPEKGQVLFDVLARDYGALDFQDMLADFIAQLNYPGASGGVLRNRAHDTHIPFTRVPVYHKMKFTNKSEIADVVYVRPEQKDSHGRIIPARFDTALVQTSKGRRIAQVRVVFKIPKKKIDEVFHSPDIGRPSHLAYVEWFTPIPARPEPKHHMYKVSRSFLNGRRNAAIIPVSSIICSIHLLPRFGPVLPRDWNSFTILEGCHTFYINPFADMHSYLTFG